MNLSFANNCFFQQQQKNHLMSLKNYNEMRAHTKSAPYFPEKPNALFMVINIVKIRIYSLFD